MTADAFGPSSALDPAPAALLPLTALFQQWGPGVAPDRVNGLAREFLRHAALIGAELEGREKAGRIGQAVRREAKRLLRVPDAVLLDAVRGASDDLRSEFSVRYCPGDAPIEAAREALRLVSEMGAGARERAQDDPRGEPWALKGRPEHPGLDDLVTRLAAIYAELTGARPTDSRPSDTRPEGSGFFKFAVAVDNLAAAPEGLSEIDRHRRVVKRLKKDSKDREEAESARARMRRAVADDARAVFATLRRETET